MSETVYTIDYFIRKFEAIPAWRFTIGTCVTMDGRRCAIGHCGVNSLQATLSDYPPEAQALIQLIGGGSDIGLTTINDDGPAETAKARILESLRALSR